MNKSLVFISAIFLVGVGLYVLNSYLPEEKQSESNFTTNFKTAVFNIDGEELSIGSSLQFFGNELVTDLNSDAREDVVFLVTHEGGGSGIFYYVVAALQTETGYVGTDGYFLGDRIAPQTTNASQNPSHQGVVVVNYADRAAHEPMTAVPSIGRSVYLKLGPDNRWGIVDNDSAGEAAADESLLQTKVWTLKSVRYSDGSDLVFIQRQDFTLTFAAEGRFSATTDCNQVFGSYEGTAQRLSFANIGMTKMFCAGSRETDFIQLLSQVESYQFASDWSLVLGLKAGRGSVTFE